jgi:hypothetical protein
VAAPATPGGGEPTQVELGRPARTSRRPPRSGRSSPTGEAVPHPVLAPALDAVRAPAGRLMAEGGGRLVEARVAPPAAALTAVGADGRVRVAPCRRPRSSTRLPSSPGSTATRRHPPLRPFACAEATPP